MTEVQEAIKFERLSKFVPSCDDYDMVVEINGEEHNLDFLIDHLRNKIIFFYDYGDGDDLDDCKKEIKKLKSEHQNTLNVLDDFMNMLNKLQCNPDDETLQLQARDMLTLMNVDVKIGDGE